MKAAAIEINGGPEAFAYRELPDPVCPDDGIVIDVESISIEGGDLLARAMGPLKVVPHVVGYIAAGTVCEVGASVTGRRVGERVVTLHGDGSHATKRAVSAAMAWPIPEGVSTQDAACVPVAFGTAFECLFTAGDLQPGQTVLIHAGSGGVGMAAIQMAKLAGATVIATASSADKLERLKAFGMDHGIDYAAQDFVKEAQKIVAGFAGKGAGGGVDVVIDSVGGNTLAQSVKVLAWRGRLVSVGIAGRGGSSVDAFSLWSRNNTLHGVLLATALRAEYPRTYAMIGECLARVASGELKVQIAKVFPLSEAAAAHAYIEGRHAFGRVVMTTG
ncbi:MAG: zinc-binding alcohol dehydrogenase family protein [Rhizobiales bacterium]|nr:zinc-binding alcohol dehydrogenase family protein [Rhizobacter sp.]